MNDHNMNTIVTGIRPTGSVQLGNYLWLDH